MSLSIQISQQFARIGIKSTPPQLELQQQPADLQIQAPPAQMTIDQGPGVLTIDGDDAHSALGHKPTSRFVADMAAQVRQMVVQIIGDISEDGYELSDLAHRITVADINRKHYLEGPEPIQDVGPFSSTSLHIDYTPHPTTIDWTTQDAQITATPHPAHLNYTPGAVSVYLAQQNGLHIGLKGNYLNMTF